MGSVERYIENPKTIGSGILCAIPQTGSCPVNCGECFFNRREGYLYPFEEHLPNMPTVEQAQGRVVRVNDGNDSNIQRGLVMEMTKIYKDKFYNTSIPKDLEGFGAPVVLTINPASPVKRTDTDFYRLDPIPKNLMFVRMLTNAWNLPLVDQAVEYYTTREVPVVLTFMRYYFTPIPEEYKSDYIFKKKIMNEYWMIKTDAWRKIMARYENNKYVSSCGKIEGGREKKGEESLKDVYKCRYCGNCLREYFATMERLRVPRVGVEPT